MRFGKNRSAEPGESVISCTPIFPNNADKPSYRGRFAPSPTGPLHLGSLFTALASFLEARAHGGLWWVRIDDIDAPRTVPGAAEQILRTLEHFGLLWDGEVVFQSQRLENYHHAIKVLGDKGLLYPCDCSRKHIASLASRAIAEPAYPGICRDRPTAPAPPFALRLRTDNRSISLNDRMQGVYTQNFAAEVGDFVVVRRDGAYAYHLATVVDDALAGITEVLRGADLLTSTPRQVLLQECLGVEVPDYLHIPVIIDHTGVKLSKQNGASPVPMDNPPRVLFLLLQLLQQSPPEELLTASVDEILTWALSTWNIDRLIRTRQKTVELLP